MPPLRTAIGGDDPRRLGALSPQPPSTQLWQQIGVRHSNATYGVQKKCSTFKRDARRPNKTLSFKCKFSTLRTTSKSLFWPKPLLLSTLCLRWLSKQCQCFGAFGVQTRRSAFNCGVRHLAFKFIGRNDFWHPLANGDGGRWPQSPGGG